MADMSATTEPKSDQLDNLELRGEPRIFTVTSVDVKDPNADQPVVVHLAEFPRPWKPGKNMRRALKFCWGKETDNWIGEQVELYSDETVKFGNETPGGTRISRISGIENPTSVPILLGQGKPGVWKVNPLPAQTPTPTPEPTQPEPTAEQVASCTDRLTLQSMWRRSGPEMRATIEQRVADLANEPGQDEGAEA